MGEALEHVTHKLRPQLVPLSETKSFPDFVVPSVIGNSYGDIYEKQLAEAKDSGLNHLDKDGVPPQWEPYLKDFIHDEPVIVKHPMPKWIQKELDANDKMRADAQNKFKL